MLDIKNAWRQLRHKILPASKNDLDSRANSLFQFQMESLKILESLSNRLQILEAQGENLGKIIDRVDVRLRSENKESAKKFVELAYRAVLKRDADAEGLAHFTSSLVNHHVDYSEVLVSLMSGYEYLYSTETDPQFKNFTDQNIKERTLKIINFQPYSLNDLENAAPEFHGVDYYEVHKKRFLELVNYLAYREFTTSKKINVLECGSTLSTKLIKSLIPEAALSISDFKPLSDIEAASSFPMSEIIEKHYQVDFMRDDLDTIELADSPRFDVILLCEVIEHLLVNPHKVIRFLLRHLSDEGQLYITTPNIFQHSYVNAFRNKVNPLPLYPEEYSLDESPHFHLREYGMAELLKICANSGASIEAYYFSSCWDSAKLIAEIPEHELSNLVIIVKRSAIQKTEHRQ